MTRLAGCARLVALLPRDTPRPRSRGQGTTVLRWLGVWLSWSRWVKDIPRSCRAGPDRNWLLAGFSGLLCW